LDHSIFVVGFLRIFDFSVLSDFISGFRSFLFILFHQSQVR